MEYSQRKRKMQLLESKKRRPSLELNAKKSKLVNAGKTVAQMLQQKKTHKPTTNDNSDEIEEIEINDSDSNEAVVSTSVCDVIDSVAKGEERPNGEEKNVSNGSSDVDDIKKDCSVNASKLPEGLPQDLNTLIERIKRVNMICYVHNVNKLTLPCLTVGPHHSRWKTQFLQ